MCVWRLTRVRSLLSLSYQSIREGVDDLAGALPMDVRRTYSPGPVTDGTSNDELAADKEEAYDTSSAPGHDKAAAWRAARVALGSALLVPLAIGSGCEVPGGASVAKAIYYLMWGCRRA